MQAKSKTLLRVARLIGSKKIDGSVWSRSFYDFIKKRIKEWVFIDMVGGGHSSRAFIEPRARWMMFAGNHAA
jgi:hypothetical protein